MVTSVRRAASIINQLQKSNEITSIGNVENVHLTDVFDFHTRADRKFGPPNIFTSFHAVANFTASTHWQHLIAHFADPNRFWGQIAAKLLKYLIQSARRERNSIQNGFDTFFANYQTHFLAIAFRIKTNKKHLQNNPVRTKFGKTYKKELFQLIGGSFSKPFITFAVQTNVRPAVCHLIHLLTL